MTPDFLTTDRKIVLPTAGSPSAKDSLRVAGDSFREALNRKPAVADAPQDSASGLSLITPVNETRTRSGGQLDPEVDVAGSAQLLSNESTDQAPSAPSETGSVEASKPQQTGDESSGARSLETTSSGPQDSAGFEPSAVEQTARRPLGETHTGEPTAPNAADVVGDTPSDVHRRGTIEETVATSATQISAGVPGSALPTSDEVLLDAAVISETVTDGPDTQTSTLDRDLLSGSDWLLDDFSTLSRNAASLNSIPALSNRVVDEFDFNEILPELPSLQGTRQGAGADEAFTDRIVYQAADHEVSNDADIAELDQLADASLADDFRTLNSLPENVESAAVSVPRVDASKTTFDDEYPAVLKSLQAGVETAPVKLPEDSIQVDRESTGIELDNVPPSIQSTLEADQVTAEFFTHQKTVTASSHESKYEHSSQQSPEVAPKLPVEFAAGQTGASASLSERAGVATDAVPSTTTGETGVNEQRSVIARPKAATDAQNPTTEPTEPTERSVDAPRLIQPDHRRVGLHSEASASSEVTPDKARSTAASSAKAVLPQPEQLQGRVSASQTTATSETKDDHTIPVRATSLATETEAVAAVLAAGEKASKSQLADDSVSVPTVKLTTKARAATQLAQPRQVIETPPPLSASVETSIDDSVQINPIVDDQSTLESTQSEIKRHSVSVEPVQRDNFENTQPVNLEPQQRQSQSSTTRKTENYSAVQQSSVSQNTNEQRPAAAPQPVSNSGSTPVRLAGGGTDPETRPVTSPERSVTVPSFNVNQRSGTELTQPQPRISLSPAAIQSSELAAAQPVLSRHNIITASVESVADANSTVPADQPAADAGNAVTDLAESSTSSASSTRVDIASSRGAVRSSQVEVHHNPVPQSLDVEQTVASIRDAIDGRNPLRIQFTPPELGAMQIELTQSENGIVARLEVHTVSAHRTLIDTLPELQRSLAQSGATVDRIELVLTESRSDTSQQNRDQPRRESAEREQSGRQNGDSEQRRRDQEAERREQERQRRRQHQQEPVE